MRAARMRKTLLNPNLTRTLPYGDHARLLAGGGAHGVTRPT
jgi:hypothetical protein